MAPPSLTFDEFRHRYELRAPGKKARFPSELKKLVAADGLRVLGRAPAREVEFGKPPGFDGDKNARNRYIWVIDASGVPYIRETILPTIGRKLPKHTNLTGGGPAYLGGELWFESRAELYVSGGSGRYPPKSESQLDDAVDVFRGFGYGVTSLGWDEGPSMARRFLGRFA